MELAGLVQKIRFHLQIGVIDDGNEHVNEDKEDKEDVNKEVEWTEEALRVLQSLKVEVAQNDAEEGHAERRQSWGGIAS